MCVQGIGLALAPLSSIALVCPLSAWSVKSLAWVLPSFFYRLLGGKWAGDIYLQKSACRGIPEEWSLGHKCHCMYHVDGWHLLVFVAHNLCLLQLFIWALFCPLYQPLWRQEEPSEPQLPPFPLDLIRAFSWDPLRSGSSCQDNPKASVSVYIRSLWLYPRS